MSIRYIRILPLLLAASLLPAIAPAQSTQNPDPNAPAQNQYDLKQEAAQNKAQAKQSKANAKASKKAAKADKQAAKKEGKVQKSQQKAADANEKANPPQ